MTRADGHLTADLDPQDHGPQDACGVIGVYAPGEEVATLGSFGMYALPHRGQESAGMALTDGRRTKGFK
ncbi:MAG: amidophosphoribosyltransferase, partial [Acidipropionibacterium jensenii]|nr:amidophosphoribosyltransferase [Acidipropionibacterium jensenii]